MTLAEVIKAAQAADDAFTAAVKEAGFKSRWDWDYRQPGSYVKLRRAYLNKVAADSVAHEAWVANRTL